MVYQGIYYFGFRNPNVKPNVEQQKVPEIEKQFSNKKKNLVHDDCICVQTLTASGTLLFC